MTERVFKAADLPLDRLAAIMKEFVAGELAPLRARIDALEAKPAVEYRGIHEEAKSYPPGSLVTKHGGLWLAERRTKANPAGPQSGWRLVVKRGTAA